MTAPNAIESPLNDYRLMRQLLNYPHVAFSSATSKKLGLHLWYLSEELVGLALFDSRLSNDERRQMVITMQDEAPEHPPKRSSVKSEAFLGTAGLSQFCTANSKRLLANLSITDTLLMKDPAHWGEDESFKNALGLAKGFTVVNDRAERGVALIQDFNKTLTKDEEQLQFLLQVVSDHRRLFPDCTKETIIANVNSGAQTK